MAYLQIAHSFRAPSTSTQHDQNPFAVSFQSSACDVNIFQFDYNLEEEEAERKVRLEQI